MRYFKKVIILSVLICILPKRAYAYVNPGIGSSICQIIIASLVLGLFFIKTLFNKIRIFFVRLLFRKKQPNNGRKK